MPDLRKYWQEVRTLAGSLPSFLWMVSGEGYLIEVAAEIAAKLILAKSHRVATEEEIRRRAEEEAATNRELAREGLRKRGIEVVAVRRDDIA